MFYVLTSTHFSIKLVIKKFNFSHIFFAFSVFLHFSQIKEKFGKLIKKNFLDIFPCRFYRLIIWIQLKMKENDVG